MRYLLHPGRMWNPGHGAREASSYTLSSGLPGETPVNAIMLFDLLPSVLGHCDQAYQHPTASTSLARGTASTHPHPSIHLGLQPDRITDRLGESELDR